MRCVQAAISQSSEVLPVTYPFTNSEVHMSSEKLAGIARLVRLTISCALVILAAQWLWTDTATAARAEEEPCEFADPNDPDPDFRVCYKDKKHIYSGSCEGIDCYPRMEACCSGS